MNVVPINAIEQTPIEKLIIAKVVKKSLACVKPQYIDCCVHKLPGQKKIHKQPRTFILHFLKFIIIRILSLVIITSSYDLIYERKDF